MFLQKCPFFFKFSISVCLMLFSEVEQDERHANCSYVSNYDLFQNGKAVKDSLITRLMCPGKKAL